MSFGSNCTVLKKVRRTLLGLFGGLRRHLAPPAVIRPPVVILRPENCAPFVTPLRLDLEDYKSRDFEYCKEMVLKNFYNLTILFVVFAGEKQPKRV